MEKTLSLDDMAKMPIGDVARLPVDALFALQEEVDALNRRAKTTSEWFNAALTLRFSGPGAAARSGKFGVSHVPDGDFVAEVYATKSVSWDQAKLGAAVSALRTVWEVDPTKFVTIRYEISEASYPAWPASLRKLFEGARAERAEPVRVRLVPAPAEAAA
ncbi:hypothetical protein UFOVP452_48 [uncultured Caudovirales phage]|uniref:Uncharacterized protein n=1 Tax=uncultured Caudovirales phage TaxID=2100421 RepID=A0A6J5MAX9_9CAUD|nr:hypothetical protein UFOVP452_48 [uncultured Caudovirales phage]